MEEYSAVEQGGRWFVVPELKRKHAEFARIWDANLKAQGYWEAFL